MKNYVVRICRANPPYLDSTSGFVKDEELQALLVCSVRRGQLELPSLATEKILAD